MKKIGVILFGIIFVGAGIFLLIKGNAQAKRCTVEAVGTVVEVVEETSTDTDGDISYTYYPVIKYEAGERTVTKKSNVGSGNQKYNINDTINILYNPEDVEEYIIKGDKTTNILGIAFIALGAIVCIFGIVKEV